MNPTSYDVIAWCEMTATKRKILTHTICYSKYYALPLDSKRIWIAYLQEKLVSA